MRVFQRKLILDSLNTLEEACLEIERACEKGDARHVLQRLADCGAFVEGIQQFIIESAGERTQTEALMDEFRDALTRAHHAISGGAENIDPTIKELHDCLARIENSARNESKPDRIELVFISWRAMQFDALESVYLAARADPDCDACVVTVPYYEMNDDGSHGKMYYEDAKYYKKPNYSPDIETVDYRDYDFEARHPDVIFVNNPYDGWARNAQIHPDFFSDKLKKFTELLIYIPYFVTTLNDEMITPAGAYADKVILTSEAVRKNYIEAYQKHFGNDLGNLDEKFLALGSPKFDKIINAKPEDFELPSDWQKLIGERKIILLNTHMFAWIQGGESYFKKLRSVFKVFRNRDDVVLLWRPHPNTEMNFRTIARPYLKEYYAIVDEFKNGGFGIYDDTPNLHRALCLSDAYYGDFSSLVPMYAMLDKPLLIDNFPPLIFENLYCDGKFFWVTEFTCNALVKIDKDTWQAEYVGSFPGEKVYGARLYETIVELDEKLYFTPLSAEAIAVFDKKTNQFSKIEIDYPAKYNAVPYDSALKFFSALVYEKWIFFLPISFPAIMRYDTESGELSFFDDWLPDFQKHLSCGNGFFSKGAVIVGHYIYAPAAHTNLLLVFDVDSGKSVLHTVEKTGLGYLDICFDGVNFWLSPHRGNVVIKWNAGSLQYQEIMLPCETTARGDFYGIVALNGYVYILPYIAERGVKINLKTEAVSPFELITDPNGPHNYYFTKTIQDGKLYAFERSSLQFVKHDFETEKSVARKIYFSNESSHEITAYRYENTDYEFESDLPYHESCKMPLPEFISLVSKENPKISQRVANGRKKLLLENAHADGTAGQAIFDYVKSALSGGEHR